MSSSSKIARVGKLDEIVNNVKGIDTGLAQFLIEYSAVCVGGSFSL
jgi:hypothetical protein